VTAFRDAAAVVLAVAGIALLSIAFADWVGYTGFVLQWAVR
jgi:hypothetical protein